MTPYNYCKTLIVYGSYAPGGKNHHLFAHLPGKWIKGKIQSEIINSPDELGPNANQFLIAWMIEFNDCEAELYDPGYDKVKILLYDRWTELDIKMGDNWGRDRIHWWPENCKPQLDHKDMVLANIYLPVKSFPNLKNQYDVPHPNDENNLPFLWQQLKKGEKKYEEAEFISLIKDAVPEQYEQLFGDLPNGSLFIKKLERFFREFQKGDGGLLWDGVSDSFCLYVTPLEKDKLPELKMIELVKAHIANRAIFLRESGYDSLANSLENLSYIFGEPPNQKKENILKRIANWFLSIKEQTQQSSEQIDNEAEIALEMVDNLYYESCNNNDHWVFCLEEACYGISATNELGNWLMSHWYSCGSIFELSYDLWKSQTGYSVLGKNCYIYPHNSH